MKGHIEFSYHDLGLVFHQYLERLCNPSINSRSSLAEIIQQFTTSYIHISSLAYYIDL